MSLTRWAVLATAVLAGTLAPYRLSAAQSPELDEFEKNAVRAKQLGATHVVITTDIPPAMHELDVPGDPYPSWYIYHPNLLTIFPPADFRRYANVEFAEKIAALLQARCEILRRHGLKAVYATNEPGVLPEAFFADHPLWRGARVDHPNRSRTPRFAPCVDRPEVLALYRESMQLLLKRLPEVEVLSLVTTDAGSGFCWSPGLYPGSNGNSACQRRPMEDRVSGFLTTLRDAAGQAGHKIDIDIRSIPPRQWMSSSFDHPEAIARKLPAGIVVEGLMGPDAHRGSNGRRFGGGNGPFSPVVGLPRAVAVMRSALSATGKDSRLIVTFGDPDTMDLNFRILAAVQASNPRNEVQIATALRGIAVQEAGEEEADELISVWSSLDDMERLLGTLDFGAAIEFGNVLGRWVNRPFVPFPQELKGEEKRDYRRFLFQAKDEEQADDLVDIQAMRMYEGWGAHLLVQRVIELVSGSLKKAQVSAVHLQEHAKAPQAARWKLLNGRLSTLECLIRTLDNAVAYQAHLDLVKSLDVKPEPNPVLGVQSGWDRSEMLRLARNEIDNAARLLELLQTVKEPLISVAASREEENPRKLGPDLPAQIKHKIDIMNAHWEDYKRMFTSPNQ